MNGSKEYVLMRKQNKRIDIYIEQNKIEYMNRIKLVKDNK